MINFYELILEDEIGSPGKRVFYRKWFLAFPTNQLLQTVFVMFWWQYEFGFHNSYVMRIVSVRKQESCNFYVPRWPKQEDRGSFWVLFFQLKHFPVVVELGGTPSRFPSRGAHAILAGTTIGDVTDGVNSISCIVTCTTLQQPVSLTMHFGF